MFLIYIYYIFLPLPGIPFSSTSFRSIINCSVELETAGYLSIMPIKFLSPKHISLATGETVHSFSGSFSSSHRNLLSETDVFDNLVLAVTEQNIVAYAWLTELQSEMVHCKAFTSSKGVLQLLVPQVYQIFVCVCVSLC